LQSCPARAKGTNVAVENLFIWPGDGGIGFGREKSGIDGKSIGRWEGNTLVVDTNSYNDATWLDDSGLPHSDELHTVERLKLARGGTELIDTITIDDPQTFAKPWQTVMVFRKDPGAIIKEDYCLGRLGRDNLVVK